MPPAAELERVVEASLQQAEGAALERSRVLLLEAQEADASGTQVRVRVFVVGFRCSRACVLVVPGVGRVPGEDMWWLLRLDPADV
jgi:hypothetical protein